MAEAKAMLVSGDSREAVAYALLIGIAQQAGKVVYAGSTPIVMSDADWILDNYRQCWRATAGEG